MARSTSIPPEPVEAEREATGPSAFAQDSTQSDPQPESDSSGSPETEPGTTEEAKSQVIASDEGDQVKIPAPSGEGEILVGSVSKVAGSSEEQSPPPDFYNGQCALCAQTFESEDQQEVTDSLNEHYRKAHVYYDGASG